jgi:hypothetical protein
VRGLLTPSPSPLEGEGWGEGFLVPLAREERTKQAQGLCPLGPLRGPSPPEGAALWTPAKGSGPWNPLVGCGEGGGSALTFLRSPDCPGCPAGSQLEWVHSVGCGGSCQWPLLSPLFGWGADLKVTRSTQVDVDHACISQNWAAKLARRNNRTFCCVSPLHNAGMKYGSARVSTDGQRVDAQARQLAKAGCKKVLREVASGAKTDRRQLRRALSERAGKLLMVTRLDRLAPRRSVGSDFDASGPTLNTRAWRLACHFVKCNTGSA